MKSAINHYGSSRNNPYGLTCTQLKIYEAVLKNGFMSHYDISLLTSDPIKYKMEMEGKIRVHVSNINRKIKSSGKKLVNVRDLGYRIGSSFYNDDIKELGLTPASDFFLEILLIKEKISHDEMVGFLEKKQVSGSKNSFDNRPSVYVCAINKAIAGYGLYAQSIRGYGYELCNILAPVARNLTK